MCEEVEIKSVSADDFLALDRDKITVVDVREPDEVLIHGISGAINLPFSTFPEGMEDLPKDKPVYSICWVGENSAEATKTLTEQGFDAYNVEGGYLELKYLQPDFGAEEEADDEDEDDELDEPAAESEAPDEPAAAEVVEIDARGLKCPGPIVTVADTLRSLPDGAQVHIQATEDAFASDIKVWCDKTGNVLQDLHVTPQLIEARVQKGGAAKAADKGETSRAESGAGAAADIPHGKNFVVFSGDLDKTIAAFIMANGSAAMGRQVTMFFTFWGLNILRRPEKVKVRKSFVEKMFGSMMPRGTKKLGLSRMNMGGMGPKMIRGIMKKKDILSLEELMQEAIDHGVRIIACQMSMDIMGITKEELIDGVELGGVSTFLGSAEESDMSLFI